MTVKVIGAGFGRTGTLSMKFALEKLGFDKCYHMMEVQLHPSHRQIWEDTADGKLPDWHQVFEGYQATVDWPTCNFWREQMSAFPDAMVLLTHRDPDKWYDSVMNTIWKFSDASYNSDDPRTRASAMMARRVIWEPIFDLRMDDRAHVIACYEAHNQKVIDEVPADKLITYQPGDGWEPLCERLGVPVPQEDFPRVNSTEDFQQRWKDIDAMPKQE